MPFKDPEKRKECQRKYRETNENYRKKSRERSRNYYWANHEKQLERTRKYNESHREERKAYSRAYNKKYREKNILSFRERYRDLRLKVFSHYGMSCACCGESTFQFLTIDHINGGGSQHVKHIGSLYDWLVKNGFPDGFQTLCYNCNCGKGESGVCPHKR